MFLEVPGRFAHGFLLVPERLICLGLRVLPVNVVCIVVRLERGIEGDIESVVHGCHPTILSRTMQTIEFVRRGVYTAVDIEGDCSRNTS